MAKVNKGIDRANEILEAQIHLSPAIMEPAVTTFFTTNVFNKLVMKVILIDNNVSLYNRLLVPLNKRGIEAKHITAKEKLLPLVMTGQIDCIIFNPNQAMEVDYFFIEQLAGINYKGGIVIISENKSVTEQVRALDSGADAYLTIPFITDELIARIKSLSRLRKQQQSHTIEFKELKLDKPERRFYVHNRLVFLTKTEFELLLFFVENKNKLLTRKELITNTWNEKSHFEKYSVALYSHIKNIKKKIAQNNGNDYIETIYGVGYRMNER